MFQSIVRTTSARAQNVVFRGFVTKTMPKRGGDGHGVHNVFHPPFDKRVVGGIIGGLTALGIFLPFYNVRLQNKKAGFS
eukprot:maker-scaffold_1-snap-gene-10.36-mRNA-1 protein AED:0.41 eAED:0.41 QI:125/1/1/1/1/1/3/105/78